jgi:phage gp16-like protein
MARSGEQLRKSELAQIHIAKGQLGMDDETYRAMLWTVGRVRSSADLDWAGRKRVMDHLKACGARLGRRQGAPSTLGREPMLQKIEALLADMGLPWAYADKVAENITGGQAGGIPRLAWVKETKHLKAVIAALTYEQEKRSLLARVDELLREAGKTRADVAERVAAGTKGDWTRNKAALKQLVAAIPQWWPAAAPGRN